MLGFSSWAALIVTLVQLAMAESVVRTECLMSGDQQPINRLLREGGVGTTVRLCKGSAHHLTEPIVFTAERQTIETEGHPLDHLRAELIVTGVDQAVAIK
jgi:hypothetical protein